MPFGMELEIRGKNTLSPELSKLDAEYKSFTARAAEGSAKLAAATQRTATAHEGLRARATSSFRSIQSAISGAVGGIIGKLKTMGSTSTAETDKVRASMRRVADASDEMQRRAVQSFNRIKLAAIATATAMFVVGGSFQQSMANVQSVSGATEKEFRQLTTVAREWGRTTTFSAKQVAEGMYELASAGYNAAQIGASIGGVLKFAGATASDFQTAAAVTVGTLNAFGYGADQAERAVNVFSAAISASQLNINKLQVGLSSSASTAAAYGLSLEQLTAALAILNSAGIEASTAGTGLRSMILTLVKPSDDLREAMAGVTLETDGLTGVIARLQTLGAQRLGQLFEKETVGTVLALTKAGAEGFDAMAKKITATNKAAEMYALQTQTVQAQMKILRNMVGDVLIAAFQELSGESLSTIESIKAAVDRYKATVVGLIVVARDWVKEHKDQIVSVATLAAKLIPLAIAGGLVLRGLKNLVEAGKTVGAIWVWLGRIFTTIAPIFPVLAQGILRVVLAAASFISWPVLIGVAVAALIGLGVYLYKTNETFRNVVDKILAGAKKFGTALFEILTWPIRQYIKFWDKALSFVGDLFPGFEQKVRGALDWMKDKAEDVWHGVGEGAQKGFDWAKNAAGDARDKLGEVAGSIKGKFSSTFGSIGGDADAMFAKINAAGEEALKNQQEALDKAAAASSNAARTGGQGGGAPATKAVGGGTMFFDPRALAAMEDQWRASQMRMAAESKKGTQAWLTARENLIRNQLAHEVAEAAGNQSKIAEAQIAADAALVAVHREHTQALADQRIAALTRTVATEASYTQAWLSAKISLIQESYAQEIEAAAGSAARIAELEIDRDSAIRDAKIANSDAYFAHWMETHQLMIGAINGLSAAYDTFFETILDKEMSGKKRREAMWESSKRAFVRTTAQMFKAYIAQHIQATIVSQGISDKVNAKEKFTQAKLGAVKAYQAFAFIPLVGPALGAAAAAAAFAFLMAFNRGGLVPGRGPNRDSVPAVLTPGEFVLRREVVERVGVDALTTLNQTGRLPDRGITPVYQFNLSGSRNFVDDMGEFIEKTIIPQLEEKMQDGRFRGTLKPARAY